MKDASEDWLRENDNQKVVDALRDIGIAARSVYDLVNTRQSYPEAIQTLIDLLPLVTHDRIKEGVARALTVKEARPVAARPLIGEFLRVPYDNPSQHATKESIGNALSVVADDSVFDEIMAIVSDKRHGLDRAMLAIALCKMKAHRDEATAKLIELLDDADIGPMAVRALGRLRATTARSKIEGYLQHKHSWVRQEAKRALAKIDKGPPNRSRKKS